MGICVRWTSPPQRAPLQRHQLPKTDSNCFFALGGHLASAGHRRPSGHLFFVTSPPRQIATVTSPSVGTCRPMGICVPSCSLVSALLHLAGLYLWASPPQRAPQLLSSSLLFLVPRVFHPTSSCFSLSFSPCLVGISHASPALASASRRGRRPTPGLLALPLSGGEVTGILALGVHQVVEFASAGTESGL